MHGAPAVELLPRQPGYVRERIQPPSPIRKDAPRPPQFPSHSRPHSQPASALPLLFPVMVEIPEAPALLPEGERPTILIHGAQAEEPLRALPDCLQEIIP